MSNATPEELANAASAPGTFSFIDRLRGRNYPSDDVTVYLNEAAGYAIRKLEEKVSKTADAEKVKELEDRLLALRDQARASAYTFTIRGISSEAYDAIVDEVEETIPTEWDETTSPLTGQKSRTPVPSEEREVLFQSLLWAAFIEDITDGSTGAKNGKPGPDEIRQFRQLLPIDGVRQIAVTINKLRMTNEWMEQIQDEGFFPTP